MATLLALESSCDETSAAIIQDGKLLANVIATQAVHESYGGVVPELASRAHQQHIVPVVQDVLKKAKLELSDLQAIAVTEGPGLMGALLVGVNFAKGLALALQKPLIGVHHMKAHVLAHFIEDPKPQFPFLCLTVSGGHTQLVKIDSPLEMTVLGETLDDAVGEAFDKTAKLIGLPYPGGPLIDKYAQLGNSEAFSFAKHQRDDLNFSFSGIKTSIRYFLEKEYRKDEHFVTRNLNDICASVQNNLVTALLTQLEKAVQQTGITDVAIAGGVSANSSLRARLTALGQAKGWNTFIPKFEYCTDNAGMIAMAAHYLYEAGEFREQSLKPNPRLAF